jgi:hypothetical protein
MYEHIVKNVEGSSYGQILGIILAFVEKKRKKSHKISHNKEPNLNMEAEIHAKTIVTIYQITK